MIVAEGTAEAAVFIGGTKYNLPVRKGTLGTDVVASEPFIRIGRFTYNTGFTFTASC